MTEAKILNKAKSPPPKKADPEVGAWRSVATIIAGLRSEIASLKSQLAALSSKIGEKEEK